MGRIKKLTQPEDAYALAVAGDTFVFVDESAVHKNEADSLQRNTYILSGVAIDYSHLAQARQGLALYARKWDKNRGKADGELKVHAREMLPSQSGKDALEGICTLIHDFPEYFIPITATAEYDFPDDEQAARTACIRVICEKVEELLSTHNTKELTRHPAGIIFERRSGVGGLNGDDVKTVRSILGKDFFSCYVTPEKEFLLGYPDVVASVKRQSELTSNRGSSRWFSKYLKRTIVELEATTDSDSYSAYDTEKPPQAVKAHPPGLS